MKKPTTGAKETWGMTMQHQHPTKDAPGQTYNNQNQQKTASTIYEYQIYFVPLQWLCAIADYIFWFGVQM